MKQLKLKQYVESMVSECYDKVIAYTTINLFKHSSSICNCTPEDIVHEGIVKFLTYAEQNMDKFESVKEEELDSYIVGSIQTTCRSILTNKLVRSRIAGQLEREASQVAVQYMENSSVGLKEFEKAERRRLLDKMDSGLVCIVRQLEDGVLDNKIIKRMKFDEGCENRRSYNRLSKVKRNIQLEYLKNAE